MNNYEKKIVEIDLIKTKINSMIKIRDEGRFDPCFSLNILWRNFESYIEYIRYLPAKYLVDIRAHSGHAFFSNNWAADYHDGHKIKSDDEALDAEVVKKYLEHVKDIPKKYWCSESRSSEIVSQIGIKYGDYLINRDIVKEQGCISNLYQLGIIDLLEKKDSVVVEIGSGYGQLAYQLATKIESNICYICIDYPETLFWSTVFLTVNNIEDSVYVYDGDIHVEINELIGKYKYIMIPNYMINQLKKINQIDLVINQNSFQEMSDEQVDYYMSVLNESNMDILYSYNADGQNQNSELQNRIFDKLHSHFYGYPNINFYDKFYLNNSKSISLKKLFIGSKFTNSKNLDALNLNGDIYISGIKTKLN